MIFVRAKIKPCITQFLKSYWIALGSLVFIAFVSLKKQLKTEKGKFLFDLSILRVPFLRDITLKIQIASFARTMGNLIQNGVTIIHALKITADVATNLVFSKELMHVYTQVSKGQHISAALKDSRIFDKNTLDLIGVGEESGRLDEMLFRIAEMNENESSGLIETLVFMVEPVLILILGVVVALIVMAILLPIFQMNFLVQ